MPVLQDRVQETTTTGGTGTITLAGAVTGYRSFAQAFTIGDITYYTIDNGSGEWEIGVGTVGSGTLSRDSVLESSNSNALVNFGSGTKRVFCSAPTKVLLPNQTSNNSKLLTTNGTDPSWTSTLNGITLGNITPGSGAFTTLSASSTVSGTGFSTYLASPPAIGGTTPAAGNFTSLGATGNVTLGDASGDTLTINCTVVSAPNGLNVNSNQLVLSSGNVGIGYSAPNSRVGIFNSQADGTQTVTNAGLLFGQASGWAQAGIWPVGGAGFSGSLVFGTVPSGSSTFTVTERMRIDSSGNVGIGTSSPNTWGKLAVYGGSTANSPTLAIVSNAFNAQQGCSLDFVRDGFTQPIQARILTQDNGSSASNLLFQTKANGTAGVLTERLRIDSSGSVGIGTSSPSTIGGKLSISTTTNSAGLAVTDGTYQLSITPSSLGGMAIATNGTTPLIFYQNSSGERMRIDSSGNVGIGTSSPGYKLDVAGMIRSNVSANSYAFLVDNGTYSGGLIPSSATGGLILYNAVAQPLGFWTNNTERARITATGKLLVGNTTSVDNSRVVSYNAGNTWCYEADAASQGGIYYYHVMYAGSTQTGRIQSSDGTNTQYLTTSDIRAKTNITPAGSAIQSVLNFPVDQFDWISTSEHQDFGAIAQKVHPIIPEMVSVPSDEDEMWGIDWSKAVPRLIKAIQELHAEIESLKAKVN